MEGFFDIRLQPGIFIYERVSVTRNCAIGTFSSIKDRRSACSQADFVIHIHQQVVRLQFLVSSDRQAKLDHSPCCIPSKNAALRQIVRFFYNTFSYPHTFCSGQRIMCMTNFGGLLLDHAQIWKTNLGGRVLWRTIFCLVEKRKIVDLEYDCETHVVTTARKVFLSKDKRR
jgi:hypothetical protein